MTASEIEELFKIQDRQLRKLNLLTKKSNELCDELNLDNLIIKVAESNAVNVRILKNSNTFTFIEKTYLFDFNLFN